MQWLCAAYENVVALVGWVQKHAAVALIWRAQEHAVACIGRVRKPGVCWGMHRLCLGHEHAVACIG